MKRKMKGGILAIIGYLLSPVSWWNDIFINLPLAYIFGFIFGLISRKLFLPFMILGYWITNIIGFILMHYGVVDLISKEKKKYTKKELVKDLIVSIIYTLIVLLLIRIGWIKFPLNYMQ